MATAAQWAAWRSGIKSANDISPTDEKTIELHPQGVVIGDALQTSSNINETQGTPHIVSFKTQADSLYFSLNYKNININGVITNENLSKYGQESVGLAIYVFKNKLGDIVIEATTSTEVPIIFKFSIKTLNDLNTLNWAEIKEPLESSVSSVVEDVNTSVEKIFTLNNIDLNLHLFAQTDNYGLNLGEMGELLLLKNLIPKVIQKN